jgi:hypothetical protein
MQSSLEMVRRQQESFEHEREAVFHDRNPVVKVCEALRSYILSFEASLDDNHEIGARLVSFGQAITFHVQQIGFTKPFIVTFVGLTETGDRVQLIQHVSQLSFLLVAMRKLGDKPNRIGFVWND